jgi:hypothetical protein
LAYRSPQPRNRRRSSFGPALLCRRQYPARAPAGAFIRMSARIA